MSSAHSWHHHTRWSELHPLLDPPAQRRPHDDLRSALGIARAILGSHTSYGLLWVAFHG
jgi:hypothetical protein